MQDKALYLKCSYIATYDTSTLFATKEYLNFSPLPADFCGLYSLYATTYYFLT